MTLKWTGPIALVTISACCAIVVAEQGGFATLNAADLSRYVGGDGPQCCTKSTLTQCTSVAPFACVSTSVSCSTSVTSNSTCSAASCSTGNTGDTCNPAANQDRIVIACTPTSNTPVACGTNMQECSYKTSAPNIKVTTCGNSSLCATQPENSCG